MSHRDASDGNWETKYFDLSVQERLLLTNQYRILEMLAEDQETIEEYQDAQRILEVDFTIRYKEVLARGLRPPLTTAECKEVLQILTMYDMLNKSFEALEDTQGLKPDDVLFPGFDEHNEPKYCNLHMYLSARGEFKRLPPRHSGMMRLEKYRRMLAIYDNETRDTPLSLVFDANKIRRILDA